LFGLRSRTPYQWQLTETTMTEIPEDKKERVGEPEMAL
jgi:hypothetical protein